MPKNKLSIFVSLLLNWATHIEFYFSTFQRLPEILYQVISSLHINFLCRLINEFTCIYWRGLKNECNDNKRVFLSCVVLVVSLINLTWKGRNPCQSTNIKRFSQHLSLFQLLWIINDVSVFWACNGYEALFPQYTFYFPRRELRAFTIFCKMWGKLLLETV